MRVGRLWITAVLLASITGFFIGRATPRSSVDDARSQSLQGRSDARSTNEVAARSAVLNPAPEADHSKAIADSPEEVSKLTDASEPDPTKASVTSSSSPMTTLDEHVPPSMTPTAFFTPGNASSSKKANSEADSDLSKLHKAYRVTCQFDPGVSALVGNGAFTTGGANWQGGPMTYDVIDPETGRATVGGSVGATGSSTGTAEVQMLRSNAGLSFSGVVPSGDLIVTTLFTERNARGAFLAVMSTHGAATGHVASQFYGACDVQ